MPLQLVTIFFNFKNLLFIRIKVKINKIDKVAKSKKKSCNIKNVKIYSKKGINNYSYLNRFQKLMRLRNLS